MYYVHFIYSCFTNVVFYAPLSRNIFWITLHIWQCATFDTRITVITYLPVWPWHLREGSLCVVGRLRTSLFVHQRVHTGVKDHVCNVCGKGFLFRQKVTSLSSHPPLSNNSCIAATKLVIEPCIVGVRYATLWPVVMLHFHMLCYTSTCYATLPCVMLLFHTLCYTSTCCATLPCVIMLHFHMLCYTSTCYPTLPHVAPQLKTFWGSSATWERNRVGNGFTKCPVGYGFLPV